MENDWSEDEHRVLIEMANAAASARDIGARLGKTRNAVLGRAFRHGVKLAPPKRAKRVEQRVAKPKRVWATKSAKKLARITAVALARDLYCAGRTLAEISDRTDIPAGSLGSYLKDLPRRREQTWDTRPKHDVARLESLALYYAGYSYAKVARQMGVCIGSIRNWLTDDALRLKAQTIGNAVKAERDAACAAFKAERDRKNTELAARIAAHNGPILAGMRPRHRDMMQLRVSGQTLEQIGQAFGVTRERVRQIEVKCRLDGLIIPNAKPLSAPAIRTAKRQTSLGRGAPVHSRKKYNITEEDRRRRAERMRAMVVKRWHGEASA